MGPYFNSFLNVANQTIYLSAQFAAQSLNDMEKFASDQKMHPWAIKIMITAIFCAIGSTIYSRRYLRVEVKDITQEEKAALRRKIDAAVKEFNFAQPTQKN